MAKAGSDKVIITCAITGGIHTPTMSDALPFTPDDIAAQSIAAAEAGASILHLHARDPKDGRPTPDPALFMQFLPRIKQSTDAVINVTTGGGLNMTVEQRLAAPLVAKPEMCSLNMGSMNFGIFPLADRYKTWKHDWEEPYLRGTDDFIFRNTFRDIERILKLLDEAHGNALRARMLRRRASLQSGPICRSRLGQAAVLRPDHLRHPRWNRRRDAQSHVHERDRGPAVRRRLPLVGAGRGAVANAVRDPGGDDGRQCARRPRRFAALAIPVYRYLLQPLAERGAEAQMMTMFAIAIILENVFVLAFSADTRSIGVSYAALPLTLGPVTVPLVYVIGFAISLVAILAVHWLVARTAFGRDLRASAADAEAAATIGVDVNRVRMLTFALGVACAGIGGTLIGTAFQFSPSSGGAYLLNSLAIVVLGGLGNVLGTLFGGLALGALQSVGGLALGDGYRDLVGMALFLLVLAFRPEGFARGRR